MLNDQLRIFAVVAAVALLAVPYLPALAKRIRAALASLPTVPPGKDLIGTDDLTMVLDLANRLRKDGNEKASAVARQLLDALLEVNA